MDLVVRYLKNLSPDDYREGLIDNMKVLVDLKSGQIVESVLLWSTRPGRTKRNSQWAGTTDLKLWFKYLSYKRLSWKEAELLDLEAFVAVLCNSNNRDGKRYEDTTVRRTIASIYGFYDYWSRPRGYLGDIKSPPKGGAGIDYARDDKDSSGPSWFESLDNPHLGERIVAMNPKVKKAIFEKIGADLLDVGRLYWETALVTGMREFEVLQVTTHQVMQISVGQDDEFKEYPVNVLRKGRKKTEKVMLPGWLVQKHQEYVLGPRKAAVKQANKRARKLGVNYTDSGALFLTPTTHHVGKPVSQRSVMRWFNDAVIEAGYTEVVQRIDNETEIAYEQKIALYSGHCTRHTWAVVTYYQRKALGDQEPWKFIQSRLGHKSMKTTQDTYLKAVGDMEAVFSDGYHNALRAFRDGAV